MSGHDVPPTVLTLITQSLTEVKEALNALSRDLHSTLSRLPTEYVPRREIERRLDELVIDLGAERAARIAADRELCDAADRAEADRIAGRRWIIGLALATGTSAVGVLSSIVTRLF